MASLGSAAGLATEDSGCRDTREFVQAGLTETGKGFGGWALADLSSAPHVSYGAPLFVPRAKARITIISTISTSAESCPVSQV